MEGISKEILEGYEFVGKLPALHFHQIGFGDIDFRTMTKKEAGSLVERGFPYLQKKVKQKAAEKKGAEK